MYLNWSLWIIIMLLVKNDNVRLFKEIKELRHRNHGLMMLLLDIRDYVSIKYNKDIIVSHIYREQSEQDFYYKDNERYKKKKFKSPHQYFHGVDIRSSIFTQEEIDDIVIYINQRWDNSNYYKWTSKCHKVGNNGKHFHIQYVENP